MEESLNLHSFDNIMDEDFGMVIELTLLASNIWKEVYVVLDSFHSFKNIYEKKPDNMLFLMSNPRFKNLRLVSFLIGRKQGIFIVQEYDMKFLFPMLLKYHEHLHPIIEFEIAKQNIDAHNSLELFDMNINYNEPMRIFSIGSFYLSIIIMWIVRKLNVHLSDGKNMNNYFLQFSSLLSKLLAFEVTNKD